MGLSVLPYALWTKEFCFFSHLHENQEEDDGDCTGINKIIIFYLITKHGGVGRVQCELTGNLDFDPESMSHSQLVSSSEK